MFSTSTVNSMFSAAVGDISGVLSQGLPNVLTVLAALIGLAVVVRYIKKWIGTK